MHIARALGALGIVRIPRARQGHVLSQLKTVYHGLLRSPSWAVVSAALDSYEAFARRSSLPDIQVLVPADVQGALFGLLKRTHVPLPGAALPTGSGAAVPGLATSLDAEDEGQALGDAVTHAAGGADAVPGAVAALKRAVRALTPTPRFQRSKLRCVVPWNNCSGKQRLTPPSLSHSSCFCSASTPQVGLRSSWYAGRHTQRALRRPEPAPLAHNILCGKHFNVVGRRTYNLLCPLLQNVWECLWYADLLRAKERSRAAQQGRRIGSVIACVPLPRLLGVQ